MIVGTRKKDAGSRAYASDPLYAYGKAFKEAAENILQTERFDFFGEPARALRSNAVLESMREFFVNDYVDEGVSAYMTPEQIEDLKEQADAQFENDVEGINENAYASEYIPMVGMALPIHKLILMNNVFAQGGGIQKVTAVQPAFTVSLERRILVTPDGTEIDMFLEQNKIADAVENTAPTKIFEVNVPLAEDDKDFIALLGGGVGDELSTTTRIVGIYVENVYIAEGRPLPDADGWYVSNPSGEIATAETAGLKNVWFHVDLQFTPNYGGPNKLDRTLARPINIKFPKNAAGDIETINDTLYGSMNKNKISLVNLAGKVKKVRLAAKLNTSNAMLDTCSVKWDLSTEFVEIPEATPINTTVSPEEVKDVAAMYDANQVTKIISMTKTVLSEKKDMAIKRFLDDSYDRMDERVASYDTFDFAVPEGYALDYVTWRQATFMDMFDDYVTKMLQVLNDDNMTVTIYGDPRIVRRLTPTEHVYQAPANIGPVVLDYTQTIVDTKDHRVYNFVGSDKFRNTNQLMVILNPRNTDRICYRLFDYQMYISSEIRNAANPSLPAIHAFERFKMFEYMPVQGRIQILNPSGKVQA